MAVVFIDFKQADLVLVRGTSIISGTIEKVSHSRYSHTAGIVKANEIIEAQGFQKTGYGGLDKYEGHADVFTCPGLTYWQRLNIVAYVRDQVGSRYDYILLFLEAGRYLFKCMPPHKEFNSHICSTLWADAYKSAGVDLCPGIKYPSPGELSESKLLKKVGSL